MKRSLSGRLRVFALLIASLAILGICVQAQQTSTPPPPPGAPPAQTSQNPPPPLAPSQEPPIKVTTGLVHLVVTVMDHHHAFITDLDQTDFKVLENGAPQDIRFFGRETDLPLRIGLLLDTSNSIRPRLEFEKDAAVDFLSKTIRRNKDMAFLMTFDNEPEIIQDYTGDLALLTAAVNEQRAGGGTALNDAIYMASEKLAHAPLPKGDESDIRRVIVLISDGNDNLSDRALSEAIDASIRSEASVYTVSTNTDWISVDDARKPSKYNMDPGDKILQQFADQTGGRLSFPIASTILRSRFSRSGRSCAVSTSSPIHPHCRPPRANTVRLTCRPRAKD